MLTMCILIKKRAYADSGLVTIEMLYVGGGSMDRDRHGNNGFVILWLLETDGSVDPGKPVLIIILLF